jgi:predicted benzoate:H+ symporter BenE
MLALLLEFVVWFLGELLIQLAVELLIELGIESIRHSVRERKEADPVLAAIGYVLLGALAGAISVGALPWRITRGLPLRLVGLALYPLIAGAAMHAFGERRRRTGVNTTGLATFWGGACFAFGMSLLRFILT